MSGLTLWLWGGGISAQAAESIIFEYKILRETLSIEELREFADKGKPSSSLRTYFNLANLNPDTLQAVLSQEIPVNPVSLSRLLNTSPGELLLDQISQVIHTPSGRASRESLRSALVTSALEDEAITLIEILENYPTDEVRVDGDRLVGIYRRLNSVLSLLAILER
ncbi:MAG: alpha/beta hydrolase [Chloroflexaceae bacterium]|nr:alpha/beta hydrolase [Chloroflexaceae bacterium]